MEPILSAGRWKPAQNPTGSLHAFNPVTGVPSPSANTRSPAGVTCRKCSMLASRRRGARGDRPVAYRRIPRHLREWSETTRMNWWRPRTSRRDCRRTAPAATSNFLGPPVSYGRPPAPPGTGVGVVPPSTPPTTSAPSTIPSAARWRSLAPTTFPSPSTAFRGRFRGRHRGGQPGDCQSPSGAPAHLTLCWHGPRCGALEPPGCPRPPSRCSTGPHPELGRRLVAHPSLAAVGFTGGAAAGPALKEAADQVGKPIYLEMSSVNPVFVLPGALRERGDGDCRRTQRLLRAGGRAVLHQAGTRDRRVRAGGGPFLATLAALTAERHPERSYRQQPDGDRCGGGPDEAAPVPACWLGAGLPTAPDTPTSRRSCRRPGPAFLKNPEALQSEAFGSVCLVVVAEDQQRNARHRRERSKAI